MTAATHLLSKATDKALPSAFALAPYVGRHVLI